jgi:hypothetical protein
VDVRRLPIDDPWIRDSGPTFITGGRGVAFQRKVNRLSRGIGWPYGAFYRAIPRRDLPVGFCGVEIGGQTMVGEKWIDQNPESKKSVTRFSFKIVP